MMDGHYYAVIMAGGGGTRLWPLSRAKRPKQMLNLFGNHSLFQTAVKRLEGLFSLDHILVVTIEDQVEALKKQFPGIPDSNYLIEPVPRGTASVVGYAAVALQDRDPQAVMAVLTADHYIGNVSRFHSVLVSASELAEKGYLVTLGIQPEYPATGFGYIQVGELIGEYNGIEAFTVRSFKEKPGEEQARMMVSDGQHYWNSGMFIWQVDKILNEFDIQMPDLSKRLSAIAQSWGNEDQFEVVKSVWYNLETVTIDYGIMEGADNAAVVPASNLDWNDVGSWDALFEVLETDEHGNILYKEGELLLEETSGSLIYTDQTNRMLVTIGIKDLVVVDTEDILLLCHKNQAQKVRRVVEKLRSSGNKSRL